MCFVFRNMPSKGQAHECSGRSINSTGFAHGAPTAFTRLTSAIALRGEGAVLRMD